MRKSRVFFGLLSLCGVFGTSNASASNGIQHYEGDVVIPAFYIACLGETVKYEFHLDASFHVFETPSGNFHLVDNWKATIMITGNDSGRTWYGGGPAPEQRTIGPGVTNQWNVNYKVKPLTGDGPMLNIHNNFKITVNAEGELVVERETLNGVDPSEIWQCIGKN